MRLGFKADCVLLTFLAACCRTRLTKAKLRGCLPLFSGDLLLMTGLFQKYLVHKTLKFSDLDHVQKIQEEYPGFSADTSDRFDFVTSSEPFRTVLTFRLIKNHHSGCVATPAKSSCSELGVQEPHEAPKDLICLPAVPPSRSTDDHKSFEELIATADELLRKLKDTTNELKEKFAETSTGEQERICEITDITCVNLHHQLL